MAVASCEQQWGCRVCVRQDPIFRSMGVLAGTQSNVPDHTGCGAPAAPGDVPWAGRPGGLGPAALTALCTQVGPHILPHGRSRILCGLGS